MKHKEWEEIDGCWNYHDFICTCDSEGKTEAEALMKEVYRRLSSGTPNMIEIDVNDGNFLSTVVISLDWDYGADIKNIFNDMWSSVTVEKVAYGSYDDHKPVILARVYIECDRVEHGIAAAWKAIADKFEARES